ncbi:hypothetical protein Fmac_030415 [Flemingia macrophylla]|uniref:Uncharacterized protein n=1 Tax=Flemingia macrophylla TaxID=520843 RepID=A0ABD1KZ58_9FABA
MAYSKQNNTLCFNLLSHTCMKSIKFLLFFILLCLLFPLLLQSLNPFLVQFFNYIVEKSYVFLLCNGLLVLIALNSDLYNAPSHQTTELALALPVEKGIRVESKEAEEEEEEEEHALAIVEQEKEAEEEEEEEEEDEEEGNALVMIDEYDEIEDDAEELNKKCEDFIKRMKATFSCKNLESRVEGFYFDSDMQTPLMASC